MFRFYRYILSRQIMFGASLGAALFFMVLGVIYWGAFNTVVVATNKIEFCISCHEMKSNVYEEYTQTIHFKNRTGITATCSDCHVPKEWEHMMTRKLEASGELFHKLIGTISTPEKFNAKRLELAESVWTTMKETDSRECRNCHHFESMDFDLQKDKSSLVHKHARARGKTCIDCHKGIAHQLPAGRKVYTGGDWNDHDYYKEQGQQCVDCHLDDR